MGLDQYAYARPPRKRNSDDDVQVAEWRNQNRLEGWMESLWQSKGCPNANEDYDFNCVPLQLTSQDIDSLEEAILNFELPETDGFFFGSDSYFWTDENDEPFRDNDYWYKESDLTFVQEARKMLDKKWRVFYSSWY